MKHRSRGRWFPVGVGMLALVQVVSACADRVPAPMQPRRMDSSDAVRIIGDVEGGGEELVALDGSNYPSIKNQKIDVRTWILQGPGSGSQSYIGHSGSYSGSVSGRAVSGTLARVNYNLSDASTPYNMSVTYDESKDTVRVSSSTTHDGTFTRMDGTQGTYPAISRRNTDYYAAPAPPPPPPTTSPGTDGGTGECWCWFVSYNGGQTWYNTGLCWGECGGLGCIIPGKDAGSARVSVG